MAGGNDVRYAVPLGQAQHFQRLLRRPGAIVHAVDDMLMDVDKAHQSSPAFCFSAATEACEAPSRCDRRLGDWAVGFLSLLTYSSLL